MGYESVQLFVERAHSIQRTFSLAAADLRAVAQICAHLQGIPLAIELAAARITALTPSQIAGRLNNFLGLLTGGSRAALPRQQTLRATLDWSYNLLSRPEQALLGRLAVFVGGWSLEAAIDNLRVAPAWCGLEKDGAEAGLRMAGALWQFWELHGYYSEGRDSLSAALGRKDADTRSIARAKALYAAGVLAFYQGDYPAARAISGKPGDRPGGRRRAGERMVA